MMNGDTAGRPRAWLALASVGAMLLAGCSDSRGGPIPYEVAGFGAPDAPEVTPLEEEYRIAPMDTLSVKVFRMDDLTGDYEVDLLGRISMPLIGDVPAAELTTVELDALLTRKFGERYLENPDISVGIKSSARRNLTVDGAVGKPGAYAVLGTTTLMQALAVAGGTTEQANARRVAIFRTIDGKRQAAAFDLQSIRRGEAEDPRVYAGDIVVVDGSSVKATTKQILNSLPMLSIFKPF